MEIGIRIHGVPETIAALEAFPPALERSFDRRRRDVARDVATAARALASWSRQIPPGIHYEGGTVEYLASAPAIGRLAELRDVWLHPLFGNRRHWYPQRGRPFLEPAADAGEAALVLEAEAAVEMAIKEADL